MLHKISICNLWKEKKIVETEYTNKQITRTITN